MKIAQASHPTPIKRAVAPLAVLIFMLAACVQNSTAVLRVSQKATDLNLIQRVKAEAEARCERDDGLRNITWPYPTMPGGWEFKPNQMPPYTMPTPNLGARSLRDRAANYITLKIEDPAWPAAHLMIELTMGGSTPLHDENQVATYGAQKATYTCMDGVQFSSVAFTFVP